MHKNIAVLEWLQAHTIASDMLVLFYVKNSSL